MFGFEEALVKSLKVYRCDGSMDVFSLKFISQDLIWNIDAKESRNGSNNDIRSIRLGLPFMIGIVGFETFL